jgi:GTPase SAR1 family protein
MTTDMQELKVVVLGRRGAGKTTLIYRMLGLTKLTSTTDKSTYYPYKLNSNVKLNIWDIPEKFRATYNMQCREAAVICICVDLTKDLKEMQTILDAINESKANIVLIGTKASLMQPEDLKARSKELTTLAGERGWSSIVETTGSDDSLRFADILAQVPVVKTAIGDLIECQSLPSSASKKDWQALLRKVKGNPGMRVTGMGALTPSCYKIQLEIKALIMKRDDPSVEIGLTAAKESILNLIDKRIEEIEKTEGYLFNKSPEKSQAWLDLYEKIYLAPNGDDLKKIIETWKAAAPPDQNRPPLNKTNMAIIMDHRQKYFQYFKPNKTRSEDVLAQIEEEIRKTNLKWDNSTNG